MQGQLTPELLYRLTDIRSPCEFADASIPVAGSRITALSSRGRESLSLGLHAGFDPATYRSEDDCSTN